MRIWKKLPQVWRHMLRYSSTALLAITRRILHRHFARHCSGLRGLAELFRHLMTEGRTGIGSDILNKRLLDRNCSSGRGDFRSLMVDLFVAATRKAGLTVPINMGIFPSSAATLVKLTLPIRQLKGMTVAFQSTIGLLSRATQSDSESDRKIWKGYRCAP